MENVKDLIRTDIADFKKLREGNYFYIDKSLFIKEVIDDDEKAIAIFRPNKFGKTTNISMLKYYFDITEDSKKLFQGLNISSENEKYLNEMNKYPVIYVSFKDISGNTYSEFTYQFKKIIIDLYKQYEFLLGSPNLHKFDKEKYVKVINGKVTYKALHDLIELLSRHYFQQVIIMIDDYDYPLLYCKAKDYYEKTIEYVRSFLSYTFYDNEYLKKGILTAKVKVCYEKSDEEYDLIKTYQINDKKYINYFGFMESEVKKALEKFQLDNLDEVRKWYGGYLFDKKEMYNPYSILNYLKNKEFKIYYQDIKTMEKVEKYILKFTNFFITNLKHIIVRKKVVMDSFYLNIPYDKFYDRDILNILLLNGYLACTEQAERGARTFYKVPNTEIYSYYKEIIIRWYKSTKLKDYNFFESLHDDKLSEFISKFQNIYHENYETELSQIDPQEDKYDYYRLLVGFDHYFFKLFLLAISFISNKYFAVSYLDTDNYDDDIYLIAKSLVDNKAYIIYSKEVTDYCYDKKSIVNKLNIAIQKSFDYLNTLEFKELEKEYDVIKMVIAYKSGTIKIVTN